jgi:hypothetical protein
MWRQVSTADIQAKFTPAENAMLTAAAGGNNYSGGVLTAIVNEFVGAMSASGYRVNTDGTVPDQLRRHILAQAAWTWLRDFPKLAVFKTDERKQAAADAERIYEQICKKTYGAIEDPNGTDTTTGNWNSNPKVIMRMVPTPPPVLQMELAPTPLYANPNAPNDMVNTNSPTIPNVPTGFQIQAGNGQNLLFWDPVSGATGYVVFYGLAGSNIATLLATVTTTNYLHTGLANGTNFYYQVAAINANVTPTLQSARTVGLYATPNLNQP